MLRKAIVEIINILLITLFCYAGVTKLVDIQLFRVQLGKSPILTDYATLVSVTVPIVELLIALLLVFKTTRLTGLFLSLFLLVLFTSYIVIILNFSYYIPCSCGGIIQGLSWKQHIVFNLFFLALIVIGIRIESKRINVNITVPNNPMITGEAENLQKRVGEL